MLHPREDYARIQDPTGKIPMEEPVFMLRGQDPNAAGLVREWARLNDRDGGDRRLSRMAYIHADKMDAWPVKKQSDLPDNIDHPEDEVRPATERIDHPDDEQPAEPESQNKAGSGLS